MTHSLIESIIMKHSWIHWRFSALKSSLYHIQKLNSFIAITPQIVLKYVLRALYLSDE